MRRASFLLLILLPMGCNSSSTAVSGSAPCATNQGVKICADRSEYRPGDDVRITIANGGSETVYRDFCSVKIVGKTSSTVPFETEYKPNVQCGSDVTMDDILAHMVELAPGTSIEETYSIPPFAFQGFYRVNVWFLDASGTPVSAEPFFTGTFEVFPSAN